jgi:U3 small nucleolar RNA-associated protein 12
MALGNISAETHVLNVVSKIKAAALQDALLVLPFDKVLALFRFLDIWAQQNRSIPLTCRILFFLLQTHHKQIVASKSNKALLDGIRTHLRAALDRQKSEMGFNLAALRFIADAMDESSTSTFVDEKVDVLNETAQKKRAFIQVS